ncbi:filamentous hemagglutinin N-terminal domain-containing protein [Histophilus somni]|uniref:Filamentous hemagglutinin N-terminal domain-containing protein n=1 Tax=Histophilus somni TaxID=731 RepID=A0AAX2S521_HISSO|nr:filamentous hemagglutinin N-terminal domain-containing protein [Histophilus somni]QEH08639.1 filamentous hemagglutinin N-terminal domain-containing protein [Histophilus somni]QEH12780.1 filamentous hemagglutinin N-terminal domain-containing protein [Histophilus somni]QEH17711.1 filamentous hemagglutinin N-terminal domain-containing protein [Histophilus somni]QEH24908.1 filamentous hemagglutinin N-terminal domain-containing protein [Histophilus somni]QEH27264.1 filamentous hemagglutinin N-te
MYNEKKVLTMVYLFAVISAQVNAQTVKNGDTEVEKKDGFDIININTPNTKGVSVNNLNEFNVKDKGTVINNIESTHKYKTVHFGEIDGNKNIKTKEADIAVLNVKGTSNTSLNSTLEAASSNPLKVYIANENGINVDGGKFVNIDKLVLTTGVVDDNDMSVSVKKGDVNVSSKGISGVKDISIYSEKLDNKGKIAAENTKIVLGHSSIKNNEISSLDDNYVSASDLGAIYGNDIQIQSTGYTDINVNELLAKNNININSKGKIKNNGDIISGNKIDITAKSLENKGTVDFGNNTHELKWIDAKGNVYTKEQLEKVWNKRMKQTLTPEYAFLYLTGSLLNQWATDEEMAKRLSPEANIFKRFDETLNKFNDKDINTFLIRKDKEKVKNKHKQRDFVNKGDIYATEIDDKKILEAVAVSNVKANQSIISSKNIKINLTDDLLNQDASIEAIDELDIKAKKLVNKNSLSNDITLNDGYENLSWDLMVLQKDIRANYDIIYEKGLVSDQAARKAKIAAVNKSQIKAKNMKLDVDNIELHDDINTGASIKADKLETNSKKISLKGQSIEAKEYNMKTDELVLNNSTIYTDNIDIGAKNVKLLSKKDKEIVIKTGKENLTKEIISSSGIYAKNNLKIKSKELQSKGSIIKSDNKVEINVELLENLAEKVTKDYKSSYDISKTFRKIKHNEKSERAVASFIYAKDLVLNSKKTNNVGSYIVGTDSINYKSGTTKIDALKINNELDKNYGVDNGILGINYNKVKKMEDEAVGSIVLSKGEIKAKIDKELEIIGSSLKGKKIFIEASDVKITSKELDKTTETESRQLLAGDLKGGFEKNATLDNISAKVDMELYKNEKMIVKEKNIQNQKLKEKKLQ